MYEMILFKCSCEVTFRGKYIQYIACVKYILCAGLCLTSEISDNMPSQKRGYGTGGLEKTDRHPYR